MRPYLMILACLLPLYCNAQAPTTPPDAPSEINITSIRAAELKRYRNMAAGLDAFDEHRALAPDATMKFKLRKRGVPAGAHADWNGVTLRLAGNEFSTPLPIGEDGTFTLPRSQAAYDEDADLVFNQRKDSMRFAVEVRTRGLAPNVRRLGDLRMECQVMVAIAKKEINFLLRSTINTLLMTSDWCSAFKSEKRVHFGFTLPEWAISAARLHNGERQPVEVRGYSFEVPLGDTTVGNDTLYEFEFWSGLGEARQREAIRQMPLGITSSVDGWKANLPLQVLENGRMSGSVELKAGTWRLRLSSPKGELKLGGHGAKVKLVEGVDLPLAWHGEDLQLEVARAGIYQVSLDLGDLGRPVLKLSPPAANPLQ